MNFARGVVKAQSLMPWFFIDCFSIYGPGGARYSMRPHRSTVGSKPAFPCLC
jgi:hypothetical protein